MSAETTLTKAWQNKAIWLWLLLPLSWLYGAIVWLRRQLYQSGLIKSYRAPVPVMVIGNITVGGSGKTPLIIALVEYLQKHHVSVGVISRGYGGDTSKMPMLVGASSLPSEVGDEPCLIAALTGVPIAVCPNRQQAIETLLAAFPDIALIIADDGLQHFALARDIEWIVVDSDRGFGNRQLLPTGYLREPISRLKNATVIYHQNPSSDIMSKARTKEAIKDNANDKLTMTLVPSALIPVLKSSEIGDSIQDKLLQQPPPTKGNTVYAVSGIGYPKRFFNTLSALGFKLIEQPFPDHHEFSFSDFQNLDQHPIIVTSKDAVKIRVLILKALQTNQNNPAELANLLALIARLWELPVAAKLSPNCYDVLQKELAGFSILLN